MAATVQALDLGKGADIDPNLAFRQIGVTTLIEVGCHNRAYARDYIQFTVKGTKKPFRKIVVQLAHDDTFSVGIEYLDRKTFDTVWLATVEGLYWEDLARVIKDLYREFA